MCWQRQGLPSIWQLGKTTATFRRITVGQVNPGGFGQALGALFIGKGLVNLLGEEAVHRVDFGQGEIQLPVAPRLIGPNGHQVRVFLIDAQDISNAGGPGGRLGPLPDLQ